MAKLHHKLQKITKYLNQDLNLANQHESDPSQAVNLATATLGIALGDLSKALKMRPIVAASEKTYRNQEHPYNLKVAIFVSRHHVMTGADYDKLNDSLDSLSSDQNAAKQKLPLPRKKFMGIF